MVGRAWRLGERGWESVEVERVEVGRAWRLRDCGWESEVGSEVGGVRLRECECNVTRNT